MKAAALALGGVGLLSALAGCSRSMSAEEQAQQDARDIAQVEAINSAKPPPQPLALRPVSAEDIEKHRLLGPGCDYAATPAGKRLLLLRAERGVLKGDGRMITLAGDTGSTALPFETWSHYVGKEFSLRLERAAGDGTAAGVNALSWPARLTVRDAYDQVVHRSAGEVRCSG